MNRLLALWQTAIGKKVAMAVSGILLVGFLISHMASNVLIFVDPSKLDAYGEWLRSFGALLWVARAGLLAMVAVHILAAYQLTQMARAARPQPYARAEHRVSTYAARTMRWGGVLIAVFVVYHILHFTTGTLHPDFRPGEVGANLISGLQVTWTAAFYAVVMVAIGAHFWHGIWSVFQTLGLNHPSWNRTRATVAVGLTVLVAGGFLSIPLAALFGLLR
jgi:succinate dehydrogenase / fumarate reductase cytochrome b subunit